MKDTIINVAASALVALGAEILVVAFAGGPVWAGVMTFAIVYLQVLRR